MKIKCVNNRGFTLIELMIVIAIVGIVSAIAIVGYLSWKPGYVFRGAVSQIQNDLMRAKMRAVEKRRQCRVTFTTNGYEIEDGNRVINSNAWGNIDSNGNFIAGTPVAIEDLSDFPQTSIRNGDGTVIIIGSEPVVTFAPRGTAGSDSVDVFHPDAGTADIAVGITGRINVEFP